MSAEAPLKPRFGVGLGLGLVYLGALLWSARTLGYARDEGFYFQAAEAYRGWFELLLRAPGSALERVNVERFWSVNHEHPALMKVLFMASHWLFHDRLGWLTEPGTAYRLPGMVLAAVGVMVIHSWGTRAIGRAAGVVAASLFALMPRVFYHAHLACFDVPVTSLWLLTSYLYFRSLESGQKRWILMTGISYGLLLETKHNAWLLPFAFVLHLVALELLDRIAGRRGKLFFPPAWLAMASLGPLLFVALWPWLWFDPWHHFQEYVRFHLGHEYYNMEFFGRTYWKPPMPKDYAFWMTLGTVPFITLLLAVTGTFAGLSFSRADGAGKALAGPRFAGAMSVHLLWLIAALVAYAPWWSENTPIFGGTKHWLPAYPFLCLLAGRGFQCVAEGIAGFLRERGIGARAVFPVTGLAVVVAPLVMTIHSHPFGLSFYTPLVGGAAGAATRGLNRTFWGYTTGSLLGFLNQHAAPGARIYLHDTAPQSFEMLRADGRLREDLAWTLLPHESSIALYHHEPHMARVEYQIWIDYGTLIPAVIATYDGVPVAWAYERPEPATEP
jgi:4-amino-4-deoxy-L-arabinose transferase-like glycosyltransferase